MISEYKHFPEYKKIIGIDEAGRGPIAGPVVVAAVILPEKSTIQGLNDSKKLSSKKRAELYKEIISRAIHYKYRIIDHKIIDEINILQATFLGMNELLSSFLPSAYLALVDGPYVPRYRFIEEPHLAIKSIIKGDSTYKCIAAASIVAKVVRDSIMDNYHEKYPQYDFIHNKGYPTKKHKEALTQFGICPIHRKTFAPVKNYGVQNP
ncbi:MAG TPA: ribonuclease HII [Candidatus Cloacimonetes bacterium]|nr:ribonuclease HII [Candidatus Cloacimonadota bacterium]